MKSADMACHTISTIKYILAKSLNVSLTSSVNTQHVAILKNRDLNKGNNKITELRTILQRECQNS
jgi:hypothetical protein